MIYLGGVGVQKAEAETISQVPQPIDFSRLQVVLSLCNYYQRFVKGFNNIIKHLTRLIGIYQEYKWGEA
jgi:hypothetical protein